MSRADTLTFKFGQPLFAAAWPCAKLLLVAGGGGKPGSGIENRIIAATHSDGVLSDEVASVRLKSACEKIAVSPRANIILAVTQRAVVPYALFTGDAQVQFIMPQKCIVEAFAQLQARVTALRYSTDGKLLVLGTEAGDVHVYQASRYKLIGSHQIRPQGDDVVISEIKDVDLCVSPADSSSVQLCVSTDNGNGYIATLKLIMEDELPSRTEILSCIQLPKPKQLANGSIKHIRFAGYDVVASINYRGNGFVCRWQSLKGGVFRQSALSSAMPAAVTGLDVSPNGELLGLANAEGHALLLHSDSLRVSLRNKKAHMVFGTDVAFAPHGEAFLSVSGDASARVNMVPAPTSMLGQLLWVIMILCMALGVLLVLEDRNMLTGELGGRVAPLIQHVRSVFNAAAGRLRDGIQSSLHTRPISL
eukprot:jgi/Ulvmu1/9825/UM056_0066.1